jgi:glycosyltransferase involved in cell wall biosynthesis
LIRAHILYPFQAGPWGGGNQFLKALRSFLVARGAYAESAPEANVILFNGHQHFEETVRLRQKRPDAIFVHRMDGILSTQNSHRLPHDHLIHAINDRVADATIFQSEWSRNLSGRLGMKVKELETVIPNAADPSIFYPPASIVPSIRTRLIATNWSFNPKKGFDLYRFLDRELDFSRFEMTFVGNSLFKFERLQQLAPVSSAELGLLLRRHDAFITGSEDDACSNSLIEALACGLPAAALCSGGHPELIGDRGILFEGVTDVLPALNTLAAGLARFRAAAKPLGMNEIGERYISFFVRALEMKHPRQLSRLSAFLLRRHIRHVKSKQRQLGRYNP